MEREPVESSQIASIGYDAETQTLEVEFKNTRTPNSVYQYDNFPPEAWAEFKAAESKGSHHIRKIKGAYAYRKITP